MKMLPIICCLAFATTMSAATLDDLAWLAGHWRAESNGAASEELWMKPEGSVMLALNRSTRPGKRAFFEFLRIEERDGAIAYVAQPGGKPPTSFPMKSLDGTKVTFENPAHDFPQRIIYWKDGAKLCARVEGKMDGKESGEEWCWEKAD